MKYLIVGLGNIGAEYANTRHNFVFNVVEAFAAAPTSLFKVDRFGDVCEIKHRGRTFVLLKPNTYMNLSGKAVRYWMDQAKVSLENVLIITDDLALPVGKIRIRKKGSDGGHNGLKSINEVLASQAYPRMRFGVGDDFSKGRQVDFVLGQWTSEEEKIIEPQVKKAVDAIKAFGTMDLSLVMTNFNKD
jgi:PTH1 family peptidyl-tRNA hydrolase